MYMVGGQGERGRVLFLCSLEGGKEGRGGLEQRREGVGRVVGLVVLFLSTLLTKQTVFGELSA